MVCITARRLLACVSLREALRLGTSSHGCKKNDNDQRGCRHDVSTHFSSPSLCSDYWRLLPRRRNPLQERYNGISHQDRIVASWVAPRSFSDCVSQWRSHENYSYGQPGGRRGRCFGPITGNVPWMVACVCMCVCECMLLSLDPRDEPKRGRVSRTGEKQPRRAFPTDFRFSTLFVVPRTSIVRMKIVDRTQMRNEWINEVEVGRGRVEEQRQFFAWDTEDIRDIRSMKILHVSVPSRRENRGSRDSWFPWIPNEWSQRSMYLRWSSGREDSKWSCYEMCTSTKIRVT